MKARAEVAEVRCKECRWIHEADSVAKTSFMGVGLCPAHAASSDLLKVILLIQEKTPGDWLDDETEYELTLTGKELTRINKAIGRAVRP